MRNAWWFTVESFLVPEGLILPFDTTGSIPSGWAQFGNSGIFTENRFIKGSSGSVAARGSNNVSMTSSHRGLHSGTLVSGMLVYTTAGSNVNYPSVATVARGAHTHTTVLTWEPAKREQVFIKSTSASDVIPQYAGVFSIDSQSNMTDITPTGYTLGNQTGATNASQAIAKTTPNSNALGAHYHYQNPIGSASANLGTNYYQDTSPNWDHPSTVPTVTDNLKRFYFSIWSSATEDLPLASGMFAMWESATPPQGWAICDGTNGTPDLVDHFIGLSTSLAGTSDGDGTLTASGSLASAGIHDHKSTTVSGYSSNANHVSGESHSHTQSYDGPFDPEHYTLVFIKYLG